jgi:hypothetical protein
MPSLDQLIPGVPVSGREATQKDEELIQAFLPVASGLRVTIDEVELGLLGPRKKDLASAVTIRATASPDRVLLRTYVFNLRREIEVNVNLFREWVKKPSVLENEGGAWATLPAKRQSLTVKSLEGGLEIKLPDELSPGAKRAKGAVSLEQKKVRQRVTEIRQDREPA